MSTVCGLEVRPRLFDGWEYRRTLLYSLFGWHHIKDVTQLLDRVSTDGRRAAIGCRGELLGISGPYDVQTQAGNARWCSGTDFLLQASVDDKVVASIVFNVQIALDPHSLTSIDVLIIVGVMFP